MPEGASTGSDRRETSAPESSLPVHSTVGNGATDGAPKATSTVAALAIYDLSWLSADVLFGAIGARAEGHDL